MAADRLGLVDEEEPVATCEGPGSARFFPFAFVGLGEGGASTTTGGGGFGRAKFSIHWRAVASCCLRFRMYCVAMLGTGRGKSIYV